MNVIYISPSLATVVDEMLEVVTQKVSRAFCISRLARTLVVNPRNTKPRSVPKRPFPVVEEAPGEIRLDHDTLLTCPDDLFNVRLEEVHTEGVLQDLPSPWGCMFSCSCFTVVPFSVIKMGTP